MRKEVNFGQSLEEPDEPETSQSGEHACQVTHTSGHVIDHVCSANQGALTVLLCFSGRPLGVTSGAERDLPKLTIKRGRS